MTSIDMHLRLKLDTVLVKEDQRQERAAIKAGRRHNIYAMSIMLRGLQAAMADMHRGVSVGRALYDHFNGRLLTALERAAGVPVTYGGGPKSTGRPA